MSATIPSPDPGKSFAPTRWRRIQAINGRGQILIGPDEHSGEPGAMAIAPPGVLLRAPEGREPLTRKGWRQARWGPDREGHVLIDQARPFGLVEVSLAQVVEDLAGWAPNQLHWVASIVERQMRILVGRMPRDCHGRMHPKAGTAAQELIAVRKAADGAFGRLTGRRCKVPGVLLDDYFASMERTYVRELNEDREWVRAAMRCAGEEAGAESRELRLVDDLDRALTRDPDERF